MNIGSRTWMPKPIGTDRSADFRWINQSGEDRSLRPLPMRWPTVPMHCNGWATNCVARRRPSPRTGKSITPICCCKTGENWFYLNQNVFYNVKFPHRECSQKLAAWQADNWNHKNRTRACLKTKKQAKLNGGEYVESSDECSASMPEMRQQAGRLPAVKDLNATANGKHMKKT